MGARGMLFLFLERPPFGVKLMSARQDTVGKLTYDCIAMPANH